MKKLLWILPVGVILLFVYLFDTYYLSPKRSYESGKEFSEICRSLQGGKLIYSNVAALGFTDLNGREILTEQYFDSYTKISPTNSYPDGRLRVYEESWFKGPSIKYSWICDIWPDLSRSIIASSSAHFDLTD